MKKSILKFNVLTLAALLIFAISFTSCKEDAIVGCTDPEAENYDSAANENSGDCTYQRDKFIGAYTGVMDCPGLLSLIGSEEFPFEIAEAVLGGVDSVGVLLTNLSITLDGAIAGNRVNIDTTVPSYPFDTNDDGVPEFIVDLIVTGGAELDDAGTDLAGNLNIEIVNTDNGASLGTDNCTLTGVKI